MIGQITPLVKVASFRIWLQAVTAHTAGALISAGFLGLLLGSAGGFIPLPRGAPVIAFVVSAVFFFCAFKEAEVTSCPLPAFQRQTPNNFLCAFGSTWGPFVWGLDLGQGWTTYIDYYGYYALGAWVLVLGSPRLGAAIMGTYGIGRVLPVLLVGIAPGHTAASLFGQGYLVHHWLVRRVNAVALAFMGGAVVATSILA